MKVQGYYRQHSEGMGKVMFSQVSVCSHFGGWEGYLPWTGERAYLPWMEEGYLPWMWRGVPTLDRGMGTYLGWWEGIPTLDRKGYLLWMGGGVPTLDGGGGTLD